MAIWLCFKYVTLNSNHEVTNDHVIFYLCVSMCTKADLKVKPKVIANKWLAISLVSN